MHTVVSTGTIIPTSLVRNHIVCGFTGNTRMLRHKGSNHFWFPKHPRNYCILKDGSIFVRDRELRDVHDGYS